MKHYPINLNLRGRRCIVVGGGNVAERKTLGLLECKADVTVISPKLTPKLQELSDKKRISHIPRNYGQKDLEGAHLIIASTDSHKVNSKAAREAKRLGTLVNVASSPKLSDFIVPSVIRRGSLMVTVSTSGKSPALSRRLRLELENTIGREYEIFAELLGALRKKLRAFPAEERRRKYTEVAMSDIPELLRDGRHREAEEEFQSITGLGFNEVGFKRL